MLRAIEVKHPKRLELTPNERDIHAALKRKGTISQGMLADLVVLSDDVLTTPAKLKTASVLATIFDGKIVYRRDAQALTAPAPSLQH